MKIYVVMPGLIDAPALQVKRFRKFINIQPKGIGVSEFLQDSEQYRDLEESKCVRLRPGGPKDSKDSRQKSIV